MIEANNETVKVKIDGVELNVDFRVRTITTANVTINGEQVGFGVAVLSPTDEYNQDMGYKIALGRATNGPHADQSRRKDFIDRVMKEIKTERAIKAFEEMVKKSEDHLLNLMKEFYTCRLTPNFYDYFDDPSKQVPDPKPPADPLQIFLIHPDGTVEPVSSQFWDDSVEDLLS